MLYSGLFSEGAHARNFFGYKRSNTNWGVVGPAQVRTVDYMADLLKRGMPAWKPLRLKEIVMNKVPRLSLGPGKTPGCTPIITIHDYNLIQLPNPQPLIWTNEKSTRTYSCEQEMVSFFPENMVVMGDIEVEICHHNWGRKDQVIVIAFNTALASRDNPSLRVRFQKVELDKANNDSRFPYDFWLEFIFEEVDPDTPLTVPLDPRANVDSSFWEAILNTPRDQKCDGSICFWKDEELEEKLSSAKSFEASHGDPSAASTALMNKGGWLTKLGRDSLGKTHWNRRWFVLHPEHLQYFKKPNATLNGPLGSLDIAQIETVIPLDQQGDDLDPDLCHPNSFSILIKEDSPYIVYADNEQQQQDWIEAISATVHQYNAKQQQRRNCAFGYVLITIDAILNLTRQSMTKTSVDGYVTLNYDSQTFRTTTCQGLTPSWSSQNFRFDLFSDIPPTVAVQLFDEHYMFGDSLIGSCTINFEKLVTKTEPVTIKQFHTLSHKETPEQLETTVKFFPNTNAESMGSPIKPLIAVREPVKRGQSSGAILASSPDPDPTPTQQEPARSSILVNSC